MTDKTTAMQAVLDAVYDRTAYWYNAVTAPEDLREQIESELDESHTALTRALECLWDEASRSALMDLRQYTNIDRDGFRIIDLEVLDNAILEAASRLREEGAAVQERWEL